jgi:hypothetical protein
MQAQCLPHESGPHAHAQAQVFACVNAVHLHERRGLLYFVAAEVHKLKCFGGRGILRRHLTTVIMGFLIILVQLIDKKQMCCVKSKPAVPRTSLPKYYNSKLNRIEWKVIY